MIYQKSLDYHRQKPYGKLAITPTKPLQDQNDLSLAYSPGVAEPCRAIAKNPAAAFEVTSKGNLIAVISNGTAVLGLGDIGALASKPVMEGKAVLFKKFANIDAFDLEIDEKDPKKLVDIIASLAPTFGGINLEDIKAPECFYIEEELKKRLDIPVFHDDQHGTAIIVAAALLNAIELQKKKIDQIKMVVSGAGAAAIACLGLLVSLGAKVENIFVFDSQGLLTKNRTLNAYKEPYAQESDLKMLSCAIDGADVFLGLSKACILTQDMVLKMAKNPIIFGLANPEPEISPKEVHAVRDDAIVATGRSDFPNQVNNLLCYPYIFRGALDVRASSINEEMKLACVKAIANLAKAQSLDCVKKAHGGDDYRFGRYYIIPKPFDPRLFEEVSFAVAKSAMETGVASKPIQDMELYRAHLRQKI